jgi:hypothetical protein
MQLAMRMSLALAGIVSVWGCGDVRPTTEMPDVVQTHQVVIRPSFVRLHAGESRQLVAQANSASGTAIGGAELVYASTTPNLLRISGLGLVTSLGPVGQGEVSVTSGSKTSSVQVQIAAGAPTSVANHSETEQRATVGEMLSEPVTVLVTDDDGNPVRGVAVDFYLTASAGQIAPSRTVTNAEGWAQTLWTVGPRAGRQLMSAQIKDQPDTHASIAAVASPGGAVSLIATNNVASCVAGESLSFRAQALDSFRNPIPDLELQWISEMGSFDAAASKTEPSGTAAATWTAAKAGMALVEVKTTSAEPLSTQWRVEVVAGPPTTVAAHSAVEQVGVAGAAASDAPQVRVADAFGNPSAGVSVVWSVVEGDGSLASERTVTDETGVATAGTWTFGSTGPQGLEATAGGLSALRFSATLQVLPSPKKRR